MYEAADYLFVSKLPIGTLQPHTRAKSAFFSKKYPFTCICAIFVVILYRFL